MRSILLILGILSQLITGCSAQPEKINGVSFVASGDSISAKHVAPVKKINANYAAVMPFGFLKGVSSPNVIYDADRQWFGERPEGVKQYIQELRKVGIKIMIKPQLWIRRGEFTGTLKMTSEKEWLILEQTYRDFILLFARLAEEEEVEILCIGTELEQFVANRPEYWTTLVAQIRSIYKGKLTYAANWDEYTRTPFWNQLDYIGVDAYFPVCNEQTPSLNCLAKGWQSHLDKLKQVAEASGKPILFTEYGYRSIDYTGEKPWTVDRSITNVNLTAQTNALHVLYDQVWSKEWFAGGFIWKWFIDHEQVGGTDNNRFTPQNKPAEELLRKTYSSY
ncbi:hypothetical protein GCM10009117_15580 [Gangjinia marincola]|uniref:Glycoside hydrolase n=1 Tax=Gangjinia marincola TaxID=578463 RepID=A0ABN1MGV3_9FLAO